jgi:REP element-mobilizing transposase RayT
MGRPLRAEQFADDEICIVHAIQRCVRRAFLAGIDLQSGTDYSYRREWIRRRMEALASVFGIDVLSYAILSNHLHVILRNRPDVVAAWSDEEVALRWLRVFPGRRLDEHLADPTDIEVQDLANNRERITKIRQRMSDISWFMRALSEPIARLANRQDECTGRFWEGRFKAQRIADEAGLLACAMYVDLNPIRAAMAEAPEKAVHTSAYDRIEGQRGSLIDSAALDLVPVTLEDRVEEVRTLTPAQRKEKLKASRRRKKDRRVPRDGWLAPLTLNRRALASNPEVSKTGLRASDKGFLNLAWQEYLELLRWTAVQGAGIAQRKVPKKLGEILSTLGIEASMWRDLVWNFKKYFGRSGSAGSPTAMAADAARHNRSWYQGHRQARACFASN